MLNGEIAYETEYGFYNGYLPFERIRKTPGMPMRKFHENGLSKSMIVRDRNRNLVRETYYEYKLDENSCDSLEGLQITPTYGGRGPYPTCMFNFYRHRAEWWYLDNERTTVWENGKAITSSTKYGYNHDYRKMNSQTTTYNDQQVVKEEWLYPCDVSQYSHMADANRIDGFLVEKNSYNNGTLVASLRNDYGEGALLERVTQKTVGQSSYEQRLKYHWHDYYRNPTWITKDGIENVVYIWSYQGKYPIAEIRNSTMWDVLTALGQEGEYRYYDTLAMQAVPDMSPIEALRERLPDALVSTYTYKPLVGILTATDPSGRTIYYDYDAFGRLIQIRDEAGNPVQSYEYHYKQ
jgi:hypothetical protein